MGPGVDQVELSIPEDKDSEPNMGLDRARGVPGELFIAEV